MKKECEADAPIGHGRMILMIVYWTIYLSATMAFIEYCNIVPAMIPLGIFGWAFMVELPRVVIGAALGILFFGRVS